MPNYKQLESRLVGSYRTLHYDVRKHQVTLRPAPELDEIRDEENKVSRYGGLLIFERVADIEISTLDNVVVGECIAFQLRRAGDKWICDIEFDDFGTAVHVRFSYIDLQSEEVCREQRVNPRE